MASKTYNLCPKNFVQVIVEANNRERKGGIRIINGDSTPRTFNIFLYFNLCSFVCSHDDVDKNMQSLPDGLIGDITQVTINDCFANATAHFQCVSYIDRLVDRWSVFLSGIIKRLLAGKISAPQWSHAVDTELPFQAWLCVCSFRVDAEKVGTNF